MPPRLTRLPPPAASPHRATPSRRLPAPLPAWVLALSLLSCTGEDLQVPPPDSAIQWQAYAETYCQALAACCGPETRIFNDFSCVDNYLRRVVGTAYESLPLNPWKLQRCLQKRSAQLALGCDTEMSLLFKDYLNMVDRPDSRADCGNDRDCAIDAYCFFIPIPIPITTVQSKFSVELTGSVWYINDRIHGRQ